MRCDDSNFDGDNNNVPLGNAGLVPQHVDNIDLNQFGNAVAQGFHVGQLVEAALEHGDEQALEEANGIMNRLINQGQPVSDDEGEFYVDELTGHRYSVGNIGFVPVEPQARMAPAAERRFNNLLDGQIRAGGSGILHPERAKVGALLPSEDVFSVVRPSWGFVWTVAGVGLCIGCVLGAVATHYGVVPFPRKTDK